MKESEIIQEIENRVASSQKKDYSIWTIGITEDPEQRKEQHGNPKYWMNWKADSETIARDVEKYFIDKGMKGGTGGGDRPTFVYIF